MAPRFAFRASKFRNVECTCVSAYDQLQVSSDANVLAATSSSFAFAHQMDSGGSIQVNSLDQTGKEANTTPLLIRAHGTGRVTALSFSPFHEDLLLSAGGANATVKVWKLPSTIVMKEDLVMPLTTFKVTASGIVAGIVPHPSADSIVAVYSRPGPLSIYDIAAEELRFQMAMEYDAVTTSAAWNWDGSVMVVTTQDQAVRIVDPRIGQCSAPDIQAAHNGKRHLSVVWCGRTHHFVTCGSGLTQEREVKLWDPRHLATCVHRERLDAGGVGHLIPLYDSDLDLLYILGKGNSSARLFEVDLTRTPHVHAVNHTALGTITLAATLLPKTTCDTNVCEVARILNLSASGSSVGGSCKVVSYRVPRKDATRTFQSDLYPDTLAGEATMTSLEWQQGRNAEPMKRAVVPSVKAMEDTSTSVFGRPTSGHHGPSSWALPGGGVGASTKRRQYSSWGQALPSAASSNTPSETVLITKTGWGSGSRKWNESEPIAQSSHPGFIQWNSNESAATAPVPSSLPNFIAETRENNDEALAPAAMSMELPFKTESSSIADVVELSDKAQRLGAKYGHKLKYLHGQEASRNDVFYFGDMTVANTTQASPIVAANATYWAVPITGAGGPVLVEKVGAVGKAQHGSASVINGQKAEVSALAFNPFHDHMLATGSADSTIQLWSLDMHTRSESGQLIQALSGHTKGIRSLQYNPTAANVLCSSSQDLSLRFWDLEAGQQKLCLEGKLDDITWNIAFSQDGTLLATASRAKIVRVFDPRQSEQALVAMGCGHESNKPQFVTWADSMRLLTVGVNSRNETQVSFWDSRNLLEPLQIPIGLNPTASSASTTTPIPLYDASSHLLFLVGAGSRHIWSYEVDSTAATVQANLPFIMAGTSTIGGVALLPQRTCNIREIEVARMLVATSNVMECVSFSIPRAQKLKEFFQDEIFGPVPKQEPSLTAAQWFLGESGSPIYESLCPVGMTPLSKRPIEIAPARPKTLDFQARKREEEEKERRKAAQFARLSSLAAQPSLHQSQVNTSISPSVAEDSDDDWNE